MVNRFKKKIYIYIYRFSFSKIHVIHLHVAGLLAPDLQDFVSSDTISEDKSEWHCPPVKRKHMLQPDKTLT